MRNTLSPAIALGLILCAITASTNSTAQAEAQTGATAFPRVDPGPFEHASRRRWHNPVIADLDQDGLRDVITIDHGWATIVFWNLGNGEFSSGYDIIVGDIHGIGVADFDGDGLIEAAVTRGGGSGSNARNAKLFRFGKDRSVTQLSARDPALVNMRGRTAKWIDGDQDGDLDLLLLGFPQIPRTKVGENFVYESNGRGDLTLHSNLPQTDNGGAKTLVTDWNGDGDPDLVRYGSVPLHFLEGEEGLSWKDVSAAIASSAPQHVTSVVELDYDNDGDMDLFLTRGQMPDNNETWYDPDTKTLGFHIRRKAFTFPDLPLGDDLTITGYQAQYPHHEVHVGESEYKLERKKGRDWHRSRTITLNSALSLGVPDRYSNRGLHIGYVGNGNWRFHIDSFPPVTGVIEGVPNWTESRHTPPPGDILLRNDSGHFTDVTARTGLSELRHSMAVSAADFNNDGFVDLFVVNRGNPPYGTKQTIWLNKGDGTFESMDNHGLASPEYTAFGIGGETFDFDNDGWVDILYGNERGLWHLHRNALGKDSENSFIVIDVAPSPEKRTSQQGALISIEGCGVKQMRRVGASGAPHSHSFDTHLHFGIGACTAAHSVSIKWGNGEQARFTAKPGTTTHSEQ